MPDQLSYVPQLSVELTRPKNYFRLFKLKRMFNMDHLQLAQCVALLLAGASIAQADLFASDKELEGRTNFIFYDRK